MVQSVVGPQVGTVRYMTEFDLPLVGNYINRRELVVGDGDYEEWRWTGSVWEQVTGVGTGDTPAPDIFFSPLYYGPVLDGVTDNITQLEAAVEAAKGVSPMADDGNAMVVDGGGRQYCISRPWVIDGIRGLKLQNIRLKLIGTWNAAQFACVALGIDTVYENVKIEGNRRGAGGFSLVGAGCETIRCRVTRFKGVGISLTGAGGQCKVIDCVTTEWSNGDAEFATDGNFTATGIYVNKNDCYIGQNTIPRWCKTALHMGPECKTLVVDSAFHPYCGGVGILIRQQPVLVWAERGAGGTFSGCYFDNGRLKIESQGVWFSDNFVLYDPTRVSLTDGTGTYMVGLHADGTSGPYRNTIGGWKILSSPLRQDSGTPGRVPLMAWLPGLDSNGNVVNWDGNYDAIMNGGGVVEMREGMRETRGQPDQGLNRIYDSPGTGGMNGGGIGVTSASTPLEAKGDDPPSVREQDGGIYFRRAGRGYSYLETANSPHFMALINSGQLKVAMATGADILYLPANAHVGWHMWLVLENGSTGTLSIRTAAASPNSKVYFKYRDGSIVMRGENSMVMIHCVRNTTGDSAEFVVEGDAEVDVVKTVGNGFSYLQKLDNHRRCVAENTSIAHVVVPHNAPEGFEIYLAKPPSPISTALVSLEVNPANPTSVIWNPNSGVDFQIATVQLVRAVCLRNTDGVSAQYMVY